MYASSVNPIIAKVDALIALYVWSGREVKTHPTASDAEIYVMLQVLRKISAMIWDELKIYSTNIKKHAEIQKYIDNHTRGSAYFRQFFKVSLAANCDCVPSKHGMFFVNSIIFLM
jgi:hypothetical protein